MSLAEIKEQIAELTPEERLEIAALIVHLTQASDPEYRAELDRRMAAMDAGKKYTEQDVLRLHEKLSQQGR